MTDVVVIDGDAVTQLWVHVPAGWQAGDVAGTDAVLWNPDVSATFRTNVVLSCDTVDPAHDLATVADHARRHVATSYRAVDVRGEVMVRLGVAPAIVRLALFDAGDDATRVAQLQALADGGIDDTGTRRLIFQLIATCRADDISACGDDMAQIIAGALVRRSPAGE